MPSLRLAHFETPRDPVELPSGRVVPCRPCTAAGFQVLRALAAGEAVPDALIDRVVAQHVPAATAEERAELSAEQVYALLAHASGTVDAILQAITDEVAAQRAAPATHRPPDPAGNAPRSAATRTRRATTRTSSR